jgi:hypothetical protein
MYSQAAVGFGRYENKIVRENVEGVDIVDDLCTPIRKGPLTVEFESTMCVCAIKMINSHESALRSSNYIPPYVIESSSYKDASPTARPRTAHRQ